jgi:hypothetical protein
VTWLWTVGICVALTLAIVAWDVLLATDKVKGNTISEVVLGSARRYLPLAFLLGYLMGHLTWPQTVDVGQVDCVRCAAECKVMP